MTPRPPRSTLFPYNDALPISMQLKPDHPKLSAYYNLDNGTGRIRGIWMQRDRKSTRLNSSHITISYAVFCLKKKKTTPTRHSSTQNSTRCHGPTPTTYPTPTR